MQQWEVYGHEYYEHNPEAFPTNLGTEEQISKELPKIISVSLDDYKKSELIVKAEIYQRTSRMRLGLILCPSICLVIFGVLYNWGHLDFEDTVLGFICISIFFLVTSIITLYLRKRSIPQKVLKRARVASDLQSVHYALALLKQYSIHYETNVELGEEYKRLNDSVEWRY